MSKKKQSTAAGAIVASQLIGMGLAEMPIGRHSILATCADRKRRRFRTFRYREEMEAAGWTITLGRILCRQCSGGAR